VFRRRLLPNGGKKEMNVELYDNPRCIVFNDIFDDKTNKAILDEAIKHKRFFTLGKTGSGKAGGVEKDFRSNMSCNYDKLYKNRRKKSALLSAIAGLFQNYTEFIEIVSCAGYPFCDFIGTTTYETQVSRYGDKGQKYKWHVDRLGANRSRRISVVYHFFKTPIKFTGGELVLSNGLICDGKLLAGRTPYKFPPKNNRMFVFAATTPHCVNSTSSPREWADGRFSVNCWVGFR
jgi:Rps23 Pro-64 3,4-dihydroxylase Tpa1-like proline 4-hydroxylase